MLNVDESHKKIDLTKIDLKKARELGLKIGATAVTLFMLSGCGKKKAEKHVNSVEPTETSQEMVLEETLPSVSKTKKILETTKKVKTFDIKEHDSSELVGSFSRGVRFKFDDDREIGSFDDDIEIELSKLTYEDLSHVVECYLVIDDDENNNYDYLNYMPNLKTLEILDYESTKPRLDNVDGSRLPNGINITVYSSGYDEFSKEKYKFLKDISDIDTLSVMFYNNIDSQFLQSLKQVHNLQLSVSRLPNFIYTDMTYLDSLELYGQPYDITMCFSTDEIKELEEHGVKVIAENLDEIKEVDKQIDEIVKELNVDPNATEQEKLDAVLTYVLTKFSYDSQVAESIEKGIEHSELTESFYEKGGLYGAMTKDTQVCGNYAAMTTTLLKRLGVESYVLGSIEYLDTTHAWTAVKVDDYYYFVDACWLDSDYAAECFNNNSKSEFGSFSWYLVDPTEVEETDYYHTLAAKPSGLKIEEVPEEVEDRVRYKDEGLDENKVEDISKKEFHVKLNGKTIVIGASAFVGVLAALGVGKLVYDKKKMDDRRRRRQLNSMFDDPYSDPYGGYRRRY